MDADLHQSLKKCSHVQTHELPLCIMKILMILVLFIGSALAGTDQWVRDVEYNAEAVDFSLSDDKLEPDVESTPFPHIVEGDMKMSQRQKEVYKMMQGMTSKKRDEVHRLARSAFQLWPDKTFVYRFDSAMSSSNKAKFKEAVNLYQEMTCINFVEAREDYDGNISPIEVKGTDKGCYSSIGGPGGVLNIQEDNCENLGVCLHEIGHALGVYHEQSRPDRDSYVRIVESNIQRGYAHNFRKVDRELIGPYDLQSVLHYSSTAFSKDGYSETIIPLDYSEVYKMGRQITLSRLDIYKFNLLYGCYEGCPADLMDDCQHGSVPSKDCTCICPEEYSGTYCESFNAETACSAEFKDTSGVIQSPGYPGRYPSNALCVYAIECPAGMIVHLDFKEFDIEDFDCYYDCLETKTGNIIDEMLPDKYYGDLLNGVDKYSKTNLVLMKFESDNMFEYNGFDIEYQCVNPPA